MMFFLLQGCRVIAHERRGRGRSSETATGNEMDTHAADAAALAAHLMPDRVMSANTFFERIELAGGCVLVAWHDLRSCLQS